jgi:hypothetical protein
MLPAQLTMCDFAIATDGGTIFLRAIDETDREHRIVLAQHAFPRRPSTDSVPGRLYFDDHLVPLRSELEARVLSLLRSSPVEDDLLQTFVARIIEFVESDHYLQFAARVEQAADETKYDVRLAWDAETRNRVVVRLASFLGVGLRAAREMVQQDRPLAEGVSALAVADLAARYRSAGLGIRVHPEYRWRPD